jgi:hypothetical protein
MPFKWESKLFIHEGKMQRQRVRAQGLLQCLPTLYLVGSTNGIHNHFVISISVTLFTERNKMIALRITGFLGGLFSSILKIWKTQYFGNWMFPS